MIERTHPWQDEALQLSQEVDEKFQEIQHRETIMMYKATKLVTKTLLEEVCSEEKQVTGILQHFNNA